MAIKHGAPVFRPLPGASMRLLIWASIIVLVMTWMSGESEIEPPRAGIAAAAPVARLETDRIVVSDGTALPLRSWMPAAEPRAVVLALHGFNDYSNAFSEAGAVLSQHAVAAFAYDQRGFGRAPERGRWAGAERMVDDAATAIQLLRASYPRLPLYVMGESMGAAIAVLAASGNAAAAEVDGYVLLAPAVWGRSTMNLFERAGLWLAEFLPRIELSPGILPVTIRPSDNVPMLRALGADPLVIKTARSDTLVGLVDLMGTALAAAPRFAAPALILYGERDAIVPRAPVARFVAALPQDAAPRQRVALYRAGFHLLLRDLAGPLVLADILAWIADQRAALPSDADRDARARLAGHATPAPAETPAKLFQPWRASS